MKSWSRLLGTLGAVGVGFSLASLLLVLFMGPFLDRSWIWINFSAGVILLIAGLVMNFDLVRELIPTRGKGRVGRGAVRSLVSTFLGIAILGLLGFLLARHPLRFDLSDTGANSLSAQTFQVLAELPSEVEVLAFYPQGQLPRAARQLLERYRYESDRFQLRVVDPTRRPDLVDLYQIPLSELARGGLIHLRAEERTENVFGLTDTALRDPADLRPELSEEQLTNALLRLVRAREKGVYFLEGNGERAILGDGAETGEGYLAAAQALYDEGFRVERLLLLVAGAVPEDADVVILAGPTRPLAGEALAALEGFIARGGSILALLDPQTDTGLDVLLTQWGVELGDDIVLDVKQAVAGRIATPVSTLYGDHEITRSLGEGTVFHVVRSVNASERIGSEFVKIVFSSEDSWAERDLQGFYGEGRYQVDRGEDLGGPVPLALAGFVTNEAEGDETPPTRGRLMVFGDSDFASNQLFSVLKNRDLFLNSVQWLANNADAITIRPEALRASRFRPTQAQMNRIRFLALFALPELIAFAGVLVWWRRRALSP